MSSVEHRKDDGPFTVIHVFRLATVPFAQPYIARSTSSDHPAQLQLDLDDLESRTHGRLAELLHQNNEPIRARYEELEAVRSAAGESAILRQFDRIYLCSASDRQGLMEASLRDGIPARAEIQVLPNAVRVPKEALALRTRNTDTPFVFLFLGTLSYYPNVDAAQYFCTEIVPRIRQITARPFRVAVVGAGAPDSVRRLAEQPGVEVVSDVPEVAPWYRSAHAVVVPIRAGGGTRIKILEAFMHRRPVVSTSMGIEGIEANHGEHALIGDTASAFAACCAKLMDHPAEAESLVTNAQALVLRQYTIEALAQRIFSQC